MHGGNCNALRLKRCLKFEKDPRGELVFTKLYKHDGGNVLKQPDF